MKMIRVLGVIIPALFTLSLVGQSFDFEKTKHFQDSLKNAFLDPGHTPLDTADLPMFKGIPFFPIEKNFAVLAEYKRLRKPKTFVMNTSTSRKPKYDVVAEVHFIIGEESYKLNVYQSHRLRVMPEYKDHLFIPFTDATNGTDTYGGGRYLDLKTPAGNQVLLNFNEAYNPYCAYSDKYSCPIPPKENDLDTRIEAGVKYVNDY